MHEKNIPSVKMSSKRFQLTFDNMHLFQMVRSPVIIFQDYVLLYANPAFIGSFDTSDDNFNAKPVKELFNERGYIQIKNWLDKNEFKAGINLLADIQITADGRKFRWFNGNFVMSLWDGQPVIACYLLDIEEKKRNIAVEQQLRQAQKMESIGRLAGGIAHDMNNTLGAILGFASVLQSETKEDTPSYQDIEQIILASNRGKDLMLNLMGFARRGKYRREYFSLSGIIEEVITLLKRSISKKIKISSKVPDFPIDVHGDPTQIHHAIMNICINSVDSIEGKGAVYIELSSETYSENKAVTSGFDDIETGEYAVVTVKDTGCGMELDTVQKVFEPFFTTKPLGQGSGLGLPMVYGTVKNHGGAVMIESLKGIGTVVTILLPVAETVNETTPSLTPRKTPSDVPKPTILLVDDEEMIRFATKRVLEKIGYKVIPASDGKEAIRIFATQKNQISAIILDLMMPVMDGEETYSKIRDISDEVPVLISSGFAKEDKAEKLLNAGADGFIQKPYDMKTLKETLRKILDY
ncbi:MAG: response regulator [Deltaproteobacteria bacterium]|nr:response regulator [Deltaproteobacteria bacterium]